MSQARRYAQIVGWGKYVPPTVLTNDDLAAMVETSDEWIRTRTGIQERHAASPAESAATMAVRAAIQALEVANCDPLKLGMVIVATATPDYVFPSTACLVQDALGARNAGAYDLSAGCSGFVYALGMAADGIVAGTYDAALVIGSETLTRVIDWTDRGTCVLFGDGAGAVVMQASAAPCGVMATVLGADGSGGDLLALPNSGYRKPLSVESRAQLPFIQMNGNEVYRFATRIVGTATQQVMQKAGLTIDQVDLLIPHQANMRIIDSAAKHLKLPAEKVFVNLQKYGNTSAASIPIALCEAVECGRLQIGHNVVLVAFGAGLTWAASVVKWQPLAAEVKRSRWTAFVRTLRLRLAPLESGVRRLQRRVDTAVGAALGDSESSVSKPPAAKPVTSDSSGKVPPAKQLPEAASTPPAAKLLLEAPSAPAPSAPAPSAPPTTGSNDPDQPASADTPPAQQP